MKNKIKYFLFLILIFINFHNFANSPDGIPAKIANAIRTGNAEGLSCYFDNAVELDISGNNHVYSKMQAEKVLNNFFKNNRPKSYKILSKTEHKDSKAVIGLFETHKKKYRITYILINSGKRTLINRLEIRRI